MCDGGKSEAMAVEKSITNTVKETSPPSEKKPGKKSKKNEGGSHNDELSKASKKTKKQTGNKLQSPKKTKSPKKDRDEKLKELDDLSAELQLAQTAVKNRKKELKSLLEKKVVKEKKKSKKKTKEKEDSVGETISKKDAISKSPTKGEKKKSKSVKPESTISKASSELENRGAKALQSLAPVDITPPRPWSRKKQPSNSVPSVSKSKVNVATESEKHDFEQSTTSLSYEVPLKNSELPSPSVKRKSRKKVVKESPLNPTPTGQDKTFSLDEVNQAPLSQSLSSLRNHDSGLSLSSPIQGPSSVKSLDMRIERPTNKGGTHKQSQSQESNDMSTKKIKSDFFGSKMKVFEHQNSDVPSWAKKDAARASSLSPRSSQQKKAIFVPSSCQTTRRTLPNLSTVSNRSSKSNSKAALPTAVFEPPSLPFSSTQTTTKGKDEQQARRVSQRGRSQFASGRNAIMEVLATPARTKKQLELDVQKTPRTLKRGFLALNIASPKPSSSKSPTPPLRFMDRSHHEKDKAETFIEAAISKLKDKSKAKQVETLIRKIESLNGFQKTRRLSMRDNELVSRFIMAVRNDRRIREVHVDATQFGTISSNLLSAFISSLRLNLHVRSLSFHGVELGNDFLYSLAASMESNFIVEDIDLSRNCFTNEGLANFCQAVAQNNDRVKSLNLKDQTTPISEASEIDVLEAFEQNTTLIDVKLDFMSEDGPLKLEKILERNRSISSERDTSIDDKLVSVLLDEAERAQELWDQREEEEHGQGEEEHDWKYLYELAVLFDKHKLKKEVEENAKAAFVPASQRRNADNLSKEEKKRFLFGEFQKNMEESVLAFKADGSFLTPEFIANYFQEIPEEDALIFDFHGQWKLFKRFPVHDPSRQVVVEKFVEALVSHPRSNELTGINMANTGAGDDFLIELSKRCVNDPSLLPNLHTLNFETNFVNAPGVMALSKLIATPNSCKYMQVIRLENQKGLMKSKAEFALAKALRVNRSVVVVSLTIRNLLEKERISKYVLRNVDLLRQARQNHMKKTGTQRKRNKVELLFDRVRANADDLTKVNMMGNERFLTLTREEKVKAASSFAHNSHVTELLMNSCGIDDTFAKALGESIKTNFTLEKIHLEGNDISGEGIKALFKGLGKNSSVRELRLHKQSKVLASADEDVLADYLEPNTTITKIGIDLRSKMARIQIDRKTAHNIHEDLKQKAEAKGGDYVRKDSISFLKF